MKQRLVTGIIAGIGFLIFLYLGGYLYMGLILALAFIGWTEYLKLNRFRLTSLASFISIVCLLLLVVPWSQIGWTNARLEQIIWFNLLIFMTMTVISKNKVKLQRVSILLLGTIYIGFGFHYMTLIRLDEAQFGLMWTLFVFACIWMTDTGAYLTGMTFGKNLLWPSISPKKTVEGALGGIMLSIVTALIFSWIGVEGLSWVKAIWLGLVIALVAQLGDFIQSAYKRAAAIKDTGTILPGHGGILDRCDSWLIVFPIIYFILGG